jgi:2'-5' RNA ligase
MTRRFLIVATLPEHVTEGLADIAQEHKTHGVVWEDESQLHVKVQILGGVDTADARRALRRLRVISGVENAYLGPEVCKHNSSQLYVRVWGLDDLVEEVKDLTDDLRHGPRYVVNPHVTLARADHGSRVPTVRNTVIEYFEVSRLELWRCDKDHHGRRRYRTLGHVTLRP